MSIGLPSLVVDSAAPAYAQHLTTDVNDALNRLSTTISDLNLGAGILQNFGAWGLVNGTIAVTANAGALTIAVKTFTGADPSPSDPVYVAFRSATGASGDFSVLQITTATSFTISSGSTFGVPSATAFRLWFSGFNDAGVFRLGAVYTLSGTNIMPLRDDILASSTAEGGAGGADSAQVIYTAAAVTNQPMRVLGYAEWNTSGVTSGTWTTTNMSKIQLFGPGVPLPGETIQVQRTVTGAAATGTTTIPYDDTIPQNTEGTQFLSQAITPVSEANIVTVKSQVNWSANATGQFTMCLFQDTTANALAVVSQAWQTLSDSINTTLTYVARAGTAAATTFKIRLGQNNAGTITFNGIGGSRSFGGAYDSFIEVTESMA